VRCGPRYEEATRWWLRAPPESSRQKTLARQTASSSTRNVAVAVKERTSRTEEPQKVV
jgi:hypothetical protein